MSDKQPDDKDETVGFVMFCQSTSSEKAAPWANGRSYGPQRSIPND
jgi:hypothetical protein